MKREPNFGERITNLRIQYGSQERLAESLGVSVRTVRRWEKRREAPGGTTVFEPQKVRRRERYQRNVTQRIMKKVEEQVFAKADEKRRAEIFLNEAMPRQLFGTQIARAGKGAGQGSVIPSQYPEIAKRIVNEGRPTHITFAVIDQGISGQTEIWIPHPSDFASMAEQGAILIEWDIDPTHDWTEWESGFWEGFRNAYGEQG